MKPAITKWTRSTQGAGIVLMLATAIFAFALAGCQSGDSVSQASSVTGSTDNSMTIEPLTLGAVQAKVALKSDQESAMAAALDRYNRAVESRRALRQQARATGERGFRGRDEAEPPLHTLLKESAEVLDADQMVALLGVIKDQRDEMRTQFRNQRANRADGPGRGRRFGPHDGPGREMFADLNLTEEQQAQLAELREKHQQAMQALRDQYGDKRGFGRSDEAEALREQMRQETESILTPEQLQQLEASRIERRTERRQQMQEGAEDRQERHVELLTSVLDLSSAQVEQLEAILASTHDKMQELHEGLNGTRPDRGAMREQVDQIRQETNDAIAAMLSDQQKAIFEAMTDLLPSGPHGRRGPR
ncbi:MAG: hypothetical protein Kow0074_10610 [Candidatus Zixiibacteriota bacterium]